jgi:hypothetical protein
MSWFTKTAPVKQVAEKDIEVFKFVLKDLKSPMRLFQYGFNKSYTMNGEIKPHGQFIEEAFHTYEVGKVDVTIANDGLYVRTLNGGGYKIINIDNFRILLGHVPAGTEYYVNEKGEVASKSLHTDLATSLDNTMTLNYISCKFNESK